MSSVGAKSEMIQLAQFNSALDNALKYEDTKDIKYKGSTATKGLQDEADRAAKLEKTFQDLSNAFKITKSYVESKTKYTSYDEFLKSERHIFAEVVNKLARLEEKLLQKVATDKNFQALDAGSLVEDRCKDAKKKWDALLDKIPAYFPNLTPKEKEAAKESLKEFTLSGKDLHTIIEYTDKILQSIGEKWINEIGDVYENQPKPTREERLEKFVGRITEKIEYFTPATKEIVEEHIEVMGPSSHKHSDFSPLPTEAETVEEPEEEILGKPQPKQSHAGPLPELETPETQKVVSGEVKAPKSPAKKLEKKTVKRTIKERDVGTPEATRKKLSTTGPENRQYLDNVGGRLNVIEDDFKFVVKSSSKDTQQILKKHFDRYAKLHIGTGPDKILSASTKHENLKRALQDARGDLNYEGVVKGRVDSKEAAKIIAQIDHMLHGLPAMDKKDFGTKGGVATHKQTKTAQKEYKPLAQS